MLITKTLCQAQQNHELQEEDANNSNPWKMLEREHINKHCADGNCVKPLFLSAVYFSL